MKKSNLITIIILLIGVTVLWGLPLSRLYPADPTGTYTFHIELAQQMAERKFIGTPHFLYQLLVIIIHILAPFISFNIAGYYIVPICACWILAIIAECNIRQNIPFSKKEFYSIPITLALMIITPISLFTYPRLYLGYIGITMYHSATTLLAKPICLLIFNTISEIFKHPESYSKTKKINLSLFFLTILSLITKPNYIICLIPAIFFVIIYKLYMNKFINSRLIIWSLCVPALIVLGWQFSLTYLSDPTFIKGGKSSIVFAPFKVMSFYSNSLLYDFIMSILFPLSVYILFWKKAKTEFSLNLAWLVFLVSIFYIYFLGESSRMYAGNFLWGGQITLFILFVYSILFLFKQQNLKDFYFASIFYKLKTKFFFCLLLFGLHFINGLVYLMYVTQTGNY
ncbi:hypothetical protein NDI44_14045 [Trichocoleus sp. DQ-A3]|uniref:hypothetical protein n=1 Tax=Cyanophyceae TaxID=3028117 RepID=UPI001683837E|nr:MULTISPECIES: hypothetical protein [unclassified Coleofasciculus]MBD1896731.1 hypothetical protein [Coleofasciculus sp. FACHB-129]MBD1898777.1 hypothetical protein [Coleofasciculus sp. FACHB-125]